MEGLFGSEAWYALKESNHLPTWRKYAQKCLRAIGRSIEDTVEIYDEEWLYQVHHQIDRGIAAIARNESIDEVIASLAGVLIEISFLQVGYMPQRTGSRHKYPIRAGAWKLNSFRSVAYLQTKEQAENLFWSKQQKQLGVREQMELHDEYARSQSGIPYSAWCEQQGKGNSAKDA